MTEQTPPDEIKSRYDKSSQLRNRIIDMLSSDDQKLNVTICDKESAGLLVKLLDGEDRQTIARQKNATDEKIADVVGATADSIAEEVIRRMGGHRGIRGEPDASKAPVELIPVSVDVVDGENLQGIDDSLNYASLTSQAK